MSHSKPSTPKLVAKYKAIPTKIKVKKNFPNGKDKFLRLKINHTMTLEISSYELRGAEIYIIGNLPEEKIYFKEIESGIFQCDFSISEAGKYYFHTEFILPNDKQVYRDPAPRTHLLIDPKASGNIRLYSYIPNISGKITDWSEDLKKIKYMGFNQVHLLPITPMDYSESPYSAYDLFDVDDYYRDPSQPGSSLEQFEKYVELAKELEVGLCFDLVLNHVGFSSKMTKECPDWIMRDESSEDGFKRAGCKLGDEWHVWGDLVLVNYDHPDLEVRARIWEYMTQYMLFWGYYANETNGMIRLDNLHSSHKEFMTGALAKLRETYPDLVILAELFTDGDQVKPTIFNYHLHLLLSTPWEIPFVPQLREMLNYHHKEHPAIKFILPISSHDSGTPTQEFHNVNATLPRYALSALCNTGATGICQGAELGQPQKLEFIGKQERKDLSGYTDFTEEIASLNFLMNSDKIFRTGGNLSFVDNNHEAVIVALRRGDRLHRNSSENILICCNFDSLHEQYVDLEVGEFNGCKIQSMYGKDVNSITPLTHVLRMQPSEVKVFKILDQSYEYDD